MKRFIFGMMFLLAVVSIAATLPAQLPFIAIKPGVDTVTITTLTQPILKKSVAVTIVFGQPVALHFWREARVVNGLRVLVPIDSLPFSEGDVGCIYTTATTANNIEVAGIATAPPIADSSMLAFRLKTGLTCPTATVLSSQVPVNPLFAGQTPAAPPLQTAMRKR